MEGKPDKTEFRMVCLSAQDIPYVLHSVQDGMFKCSGHPICAPLHFAGLLNVAFETRL